MTHINKENGGKKFRYLITTPVAPVSDIFKRSASSFEIGKSNCSTKQHPSIINVLKTTNIRRKEQFDQLKAESQEEDEPFTRTSMGQLAEDYHTRKVQLQGLAAEGQKLMSRQQKAQRLRLVRAENLVKEPKEESEVSALTIGAIS